ncbi:hypothetical protein Zm00014a_024827 [Zea mays]|uniref:Uncharacterized protein n=1 Tax=Zea mays TaxID=4577 RepID=A0A3L6DGG1_MAIZE|nr:hypothetical protein Zm00014a_024827 [Zea mays]
MDMKMSKLLEIV